MKKYWIIIACISICGSSCHNNRTAKNISTPIDTNTVSIIQNIQPGDAPDFSDLLFLEPILSDKKIVMLGESTHYSPEFAEVQLRLIKFLHEKMDYNTIICELTLWNCYVANQLKDRLPADDFLKTINLEHQEKYKISLAQYIKDKNINIAGMDIANGYSYNTIPVYSDQQENAAIEKMLKNALACRTLHHMEIDSQDKEKQYIAEADSMNRICKQIIKRMSEKSDKLSVTQAVFLRYIKGMIAFNIYYKQLYANETPAMGYKPISRDKEMADNVVWLIQKLYPNEKIIVWAANPHIYKRADAMTSYLPDSLQKQSYIIGLHAYSGKVHSLEKQIINVQVSLSSIESLMHAGGYQYSFVDFQNSMQDSAPSWLSEPRQLTPWIHDATITAAPGTLYDGILLVDSLKKRY